MDISCPDCTRMQSQGICVLAGILCLDSHTNPHNAIRLNFPFLLPALLLTFPNFRCTMKKNVTALCPLVFAVFSFSLIVARSADTPTNVTLKWLDGAAP